ncbi:MAG: response regulator [Campylobacterota bacterium]|nr:response regulator [Campylobacterota bacterium]
MIDYKNININELTILYVEDDETIRGNISAIFKKICSHIYIGVDGEEGLSLFTKHQDTIDIIVSDINMPKLNGLQMSSKIIELRYDIPIILTTAHSDTDYLLESIQLGISNYLIKPFRIDDLIDKIKQSYFPIYQKERILQQSKMAQMGEMISMIAHQWRQPLAAISATTNNLSFKLAVNDFNKQIFSDELNLISQYTQHLSNTINDFRNFFKKDTVKNKVYLEDIVHSTLSIVEELTKSKGIKIVTRLNCNEQIETFSNELKQVLLNLIKNAEDIILENNVLNGEIIIPNYAIAKSKTNQTYHRI